MAKAKKPAKAAATTGEGGGPKTGKGESPMRSYTTQYTGYAKPGGSGGASGTARKNMATTPKTGGGSTGKKK